MSGVQHGSFSQFFPLLLLCVVASEPHTTLDHDRADSAKAQFQLDRQPYCHANASGMALFAATPPFLRTVLTKQTETKTKIKECAPSVGKNMRCGFRCCMDNRGIVGSRCKQMSEGVWKEC